MSRSNGIRRTGSAAPLKCSSSLRPTTTSRRCSSQRTEEGLPLFVMGCGSNLLIHDDGVPGVVLRLGSGTGEVTVNGTTITAGAGALLPKVAKIAADHGLTGMEWGGGVPGTVAARSR